MAPLLFGRADQGPSSTGTAFTGTDPAGSNTTSQKKVWYRPGRPSEASQVRSVAPSKLSSNRSVATSSGRGSIQATLPTSLRTVHHSAGYKASQSSAATASQRRPFEHSTSSTARKPPTPAPTKGVAKAKGGGFPDGDLSVNFGRRHADASSSSEGVAKGEKGKARATGRPQEGGGVFTGIMRRVSNFFSPPKRKRPDERDEYGLDAAVLAMTTKASEDPGDRCGRGVRIGWNDPSDDESQPPVKSRVRSSSSPSPAKRRKVTPILHESRPSHHAPLIRHPAFIDDDTQMQYHQPALAAVAVQSAPNPPMESYQTSVGSATMDESEWNAKQALEKQLAEEAARQEVLSSEASVTQSEPSLPPSSSVPEDRLGPTQRAPESYFEMFDDPGMIRHGLGEDEPINDWEIDLGSSDEDEADVTVGEGDADTTIVAGQEVIDELLEDDDDSPSVLAGETQAANTPPRASVLAEETQFIPNAGGGPITLVPATPIAKARMKAMRARMSAKRGGLAQEAEKRSIATLQERGPTRVNPFASRRPQPDLDAAKTNTSTTAAPTFTVVSETAQARASTSPDENGGDDHERSQSVVPDSVRGETPLLLLPPRPVAASDAQGSVPGETGTGKPAPGKTKPKASPFAALESAWSGRKPVVRQSELTHFFAEVYDRRVTGSRGEAEVVSGSNTKEEEVKKQVEHLMANRMGRTAKTIDHAHGPAASADPDDEIISDSETNESDDSAAGPERQDVEPSSDCGEGEEDEGVTEGNLAQLNARVAQRRSFGLDDRVPPPAPSPFSWSSSAEDRPGGGESEGSELDTQVLLERLEESRRRHGIASSP